MRPLARSPALRLRRALHVQAPDRGPPAPGRGRPAQEWPAAAVQAWARTRKTVLRSHKARSLEERDAVLSRFSTFELYFLVSSFPFLLLLKRLVHRFHKHVRCPPGLRGVPRIVIQRRIGRLNLLERQPLIDHALHA